MAEGKPKPTLEEIQRYLDSVNEYKDDYFCLHNKEGTETDRETAVQGKMNVVLDLLDECGEPSCSSEYEYRKYLRLKAAALASTSAYNPLCEEVLTEYQKKCKDHVVMNFLGLNFWKKGNFFDALNCFECSLVIERNPDACQHLSTLVRFMPDTVPDYVEKSICYGREAVALDVQNGKSWYVLGMGYLTSYFKETLKKEDLTQSLKCFTNAFRSNEMRKDPYFLYTRSMALLQVQDFAETMKCLELAHDYLPRWKQPVHLMERLRAYFKHLPKCIAEKGGLNSRRQAILMKKYSLKYLGNFVNPSATKVNVQESSTNLEMIKLSNLQVGQNTGKIILGMVVCPVFSFEPVAFSFCIVDQENTCVAVNVYNQAKGKEVQVGDFITVPCPTFEKISFTYKDEEHNCEWIHVESPLHLLVNGRKPPEDWYAPPALNARLYLE